MRLALNVALLIHWVLVGINLIRQRVDKARQRIHLSLEAGYLPADFVSQAQEIRKTTLLVCYVFIVHGSVWPFATDCPQCHQGRSQRH
jgi:hypothetical protein